MNEKGVTIKATGTVGNDRALLREMRQALKELVEVQELLDDGAQVPLQRVTQVHSEAVRVLANTQALE
jgi:hypothetical protein